MQVGEIYIWASAQNQHLRKYHGQRCLYMGEDPIHRDDGVTIVNHKVMMIGTGDTQILDKTCLKYLYRIHPKK